MSCGRCEAPVCVKCMVHTDVGVRCRQCAPSQGGGAARGKPVLGVVAVVFLVILAVGYLGSRGGSGENDYDYEGQDWDYAVTVTKVEDPWVPDEDAGGGSPGYRWVAIEVMVEASADNPDPYPTGLYDFKLTDEQGFAYGPVDSGARPGFPEWVSLEPGERARGWVTFEVAEDNALDSLTSYDKTIPLTGNLSRVP